MKNPHFVKIVEVGPRDGLQNEHIIVPTYIKANFINKLSLSGLSSIEVTSFVSEKRVPQINKLEQIDYPCLVPNLIGLEKAAKAGVREIAIFASSSEGFAKHNLNSTIEKSMTAFSEVVKQATDTNNNMRVRGYLSCVIGCPYDGFTSPRKVALMAKRLIDMGCYEVSLGDTIGIGAPGTFCKMLDEVCKLVPAHKLAVHCHDTYGQALANIYASITKYNIRTVDSSVSGLGGCPFAKNATGNVATEDVVYMLHNSGYETGIDMQRLVEAGEYICRHLNRKAESKYTKAINKM